MGMEKAIEHGKEHRKEYRGAKAVDRTCRNHGSCMWCYYGRMHNNLKRKLSIDEQIEEYIENDS